MNIKFKKIIAFCLSVPCLLSSTVFAEDTAEYKKSEDGSWPTPWLEQEKTNENQEDEVKRENALKIPETIEKEAGFLNALGMIPEGVIFEEDIKRDEAAALIVKMLAKDDLAKSNSRFTYYEDVSMYSENVGYINVATQEGLISGRSQTVFDPKAPITYAELSKILVTATGYYADAEKKGGFPSGYIATASMLRILKGVTYKTKDTVSWGDAVKMVFNTMKVDILAGSSFSTDGNIAYGKNEGDNILKINHKIYEDEGQITGTPLAKLFGTGIKRDLEYGEIEIKSRLLSYDPEKLPEIENLIGYNTTYYYRESEKYDFELVYAFAEKTNTTTVMSYDIREVYGLDNGENGTPYIQYLIEDTMKRPEKLKIDKNVALIVNNEEIPRPTNADLYPACGKVNLIDSNNDAFYDVAIVVNYEVKIVDVVSNYDKHIFFKNDPTTTPLVLNPNYSNVEYSITREGRPLDLRDLKEGDILGIVKSTKERAPYYMIEVLSSCVEGTIEQVGLDDIVVDGKTFEVSPDFDFVAYNIRPGDYCKLYFDYAKKLFHAEIIEEDIYSFQYVIIGADFKRGDRKTVQAKLCPAIHGIYKEVKIFDFAEKVNINGKKCKGQQIIDALKLPVSVQSMVDSEFIQPLRWVEFDEEGKIKRIETVEGGPISTREEREFFCSGVYNEKFGEYPLSYKTQICYIPNYRDDDTNWILGIGDQVRHGRIYDTLLWGTDDEGYPEAVFIFHSNRASVEGFTIDYERPMIVKDVKIKYDSEEQTEYYSVETLNSGANYLYLSDDRNNNLDCFEDLRPGDIIFSALTATRAAGTAAKVATILGGNIWNCERHIRLNDKNLSFYKASKDMYGRVKTVRVDPKVNKCTINLDLGDDDMGNPIEQSYEITGVPIYYYDRGENTVCLATYAAAKTVEIYGEEGASNVFVYLDKEFEPNMIVIIGEK